MISEAEWESIYQAIEKGTQQKGENLLVSQVIKSDALNGNIYISELGDQPIPVFDFDYEVKYYDTSPSGVVTEKVAKIRTMVPAVGETVLVALERGANRLPRCLGKLKGKNFIMSTGDDA